jgi:hypothetical protein
MPKPLHAGFVYPAAFRIALTGLESTYLRSVRTLFVRPATILVQRRAEFLIGQAERSAFKR